MYENRLSNILEKISNSDYNSMEELVEGSDRYSIDEIRIYLDYVVESWRANKITIAAMNSAFKFVYMYLARPDIQINFKNQIEIPICYYSPFLILSASFLYSYLKTLCFAVELFPLSTTCRHLKEFIDKNSPRMIIFTISQFLDIEALKKIIPYLHKRNLKIFVGGIPFVYNKNLKQEFPDCIFPEDIAELALLLNNSIKEEKDE